MSTISFEDFAKIELRAGTVIKVEEFSRAKKPSYKVWVDFGAEWGIKQTSTHQSRTQLKCSMALTLCRDPSRTIVRGA
jgi:tRNA-binding EMAP/Myf-like protein